MEKTLMKNFQEILGILFGSIFIGLGFSWFLVPYQMSPGGVAGIAQLFNYYCDFPTGITYLIINVPLFIIGFAIKKKFMSRRAIFGALFVATMMDVTSPLFLQKMKLISQEFIENHTFLMSDGHQIISLIAPEKIYLAAIAGAVLVGLGLGIIFRFRGSTGGTDIPVSLVKQKTSISVGTAYWAWESIIIVTVSMVHSSIEILIWSFINMLIAMKLTQLVSEGMPYVRGVYIISSESEQIKKEIYIRLNRGVTVIKARSGWHGYKMDVLFCVCNRRQVGPLTELVKSIDPNSFVVLSDVYDVMGYGFKSRQLDAYDVKNSSELDEELRKSKTKHVEKGLKSRNIML